MLGPLLSSASSSWSPKHLTMHHWPWESYLHPCPPPPSHHTLFRLCLLLRKEIPIHSPKEETAVETRPFSSFSARPHLCSEVGLRSSSDMALPLDLPSRTAHPSFCSCCRQ